MKNGILNFAPGNDFFATAVPTDIQKRVAEEIRQEKARQLIDPEKLRRAQDWNELADKPVGA